MIVSLSSKTMKPIQIIRKLGGPTVVGKYLGIRSQAVSLWCRNNRIPADRVPALEKLARDLGLAIRAEQMRPDIAWHVLRQGKK